jgi:iron-sulfur cluster assembly protein
MDLTITRGAARFIRMMILADGQPGAGFRMAVSPGGCSGLSADIAVASEPAQGEKAIEVDGLKLFLDAQSRLLLQGVTIDFVDTLSTQGLVFHDPNHVASCAPASGH